jgi:hypothetical protein
MDGDEWSVQSLAVLAPQKELPLLTAYTRQPGRMTEMVWTL